jgi:hypothetical protein
MSRSPKTQTGNEVPAWRRGRRLTRSADCFGRTTSDIAYRRPLSQRFTRPPDSRLNVRKPPPTCAAITRSKSWAFSIARQSLSSGVSEPRDSAVLLTEFQLGRQRSIQATGASSRAWTCWRPRPRSSPRSVDAIPCNMRSEMLTAQSLATGETLVRLFSRSRQPTPVPLCCQPWRFGSAVLAANSAAGVHRRT